MSTDEQVDIVNEKDEVIGVISKHQAHKEGILHRTVIAEVIGSDGQWTLVKQSADRQDAGQFVSPIGGHVQAGESKDNALKREANEEYGLTGDYQFKLIGKQIFNREVRGKLENHYFVLYEIYTDQQPVLNAESVGFEKFSQTKLRQELKSNPAKFGAAFHFLIQTFYPDLLQ